MSLAGDCIALPAGHDRWILYNVRTRTALGLDGEGLAAAGLLERADGTLPAGPFNVWNVTWFSQADGTLEDPTRLCREVSRWGEPRRITETELWQELNAQWLIVSDHDAYRQLFERPRHPLETQRLGNFHDQLGRHLLVDRRADPAEWWVAQKFCADGTVRTDNAYGTVQWPGLARYFDAHIRPGMTVLDVGCGTGIYAAEMGRRGANVLGVDPSERYLDKARSRGAERSRFEQVPLDKGSDLEGIADGSFDLVFMSDALLFWFIPVLQRQPAEAGAIIRAVHRVLRPGGVFVSVEPHGDFYLAPWMGDPGQPWTVLTEHRSRRFGTAPVFAAVAGEVLNAGFALAHVEELYRATGLASGEQRADAFADEFPLWVLAEYLKNDRG